MSTDRYKRKLNKPKQEGNCVVEEKLNSKSSAKSVLEAMHKRERKSPPKYYVIDIRLKSIFWHHTKEQMKGNINRLLEEDRFRTLKLSPNYETN